MGARSLLAGLLLVVGIVLTIPASIAIWQDREVLDEDAFVATTSEVFDNEDVQEVLSLRMADIVVAQLDISTLLGDTIGSIGNEDGNSNRPGLTLIEGPLESAVHDAIYKICLRVLQSDQLANVRDTVLRTAHRAVTAVLLDDGKYLELNGDAVVLNFRPLIGEVILQVGGQEALDRAEARADEDFGKIVLFQGDNTSLINKIGEWMDRFNPMVPIAAIVVLLLAVFVSRDRWKMVGRAGIGLIVVSALLLLALAVPIESLATGWTATPEGETAAKAIYDILLRSFRIQQLLIVIIGLGLVVGSTLVRDKEFTNALRGFRNEAPDDAFGRLRIWTTHHATGLRRIGLAGAAIALIMWPDPDWRSFVTIIGITAAYLFGITLVVSDAPHFTSWRARASQFLGIRSDTPAIERVGFLARWAGWLRVLGVVVAAVIIVFSPELTYKLFIFVTGSLLLYLAAIDYFSDRDDALT